MLQRIAFVLPLLFAIASAQEPPGEEDLRRIMEVRSMDEWKTENQALYVHLKRAMVLGSKAGSFWEAMNPIAALEKPDLGRAEFDEEALRRARVDTIAWALPLFADELRWDFVRGYLREAERHGASDEVVRDLMFRAAQGLPPSKRKVDGKTRKLSKGDFEQVESFHVEIVRFLIERGFAEDQKSAAKAIEKEMKKRKAAQRPRAYSLARAFSKGRPEPKPVPKVDVGEPGLFHEFWPGEWRNAAKLLEKNAVRSEVHFLDNGVMYWWLDAPQNVERPQEIHAATFVTRLTGVLRVSEPGEYRLRLSFDDGARVWLDDNLVIDVWDKRAPLKWIYLPIILGNNTKVRIEHYEGNVSSTTGIYIGVDAFRGGQWQRDNTASFLHQPK